MPLVDYSSSPSPSPPPTKRPKPNPAPPPPPPEFYDLYASTVRHSITDDPSLHQGRRRKTPHIAGNWPSHVYITWNPSAAEQALLEDLVHAAAAVLEQDQTQERTHERQGTSGISAKNTLHSFVANDLGVPQPLHISLSRPLTLTTATKGVFLERTTGAVKRAGVRGPFAVVPRRVAWFHSPDSNRTFLVLQVETYPHDDGGSDPHDGDGPRDNGSRDGLHDDEDGGGESAKGGHKTTEKSTQKAKNEELMRLLTQCNAAVREFGQPELYAARLPQKRVSLFHAQSLDDDGEPKNNNPKNQKDNLNKKKDNNNDEDNDDSTDDAHIDSKAFHISIAWLLGNPTTSGGLSDAGVGTLLESAAFAALKQWRIPVESVKIKIGNVVTSVGL